MRAASALGHQYLQALRSTMQADTCTLYMMYIIHTIYCDRIYKFFQIQPYAFYPGGPACRLLSCAKHCKDAAIMPKLTMLYVLLNKQLLV